MQPSLRRAASPEILPIREASRAMVRELGLLRSTGAPAGVPASHCHALLEIGRAPLTQGALAGSLRLDKSTTSRVVAALVRRGWVAARPDPADARCRRLALTASGRRRLAALDRAASARVQQALDVLAPADRAAVRAGLDLYARALARSRVAAAARIRPIRPADNRPLAALLADVMREFGAAGQGFTLSDPEVADMARAYRAPRSAYFVALADGRLAAGAGIGPLAGGDASTCELRKMYSLPEARGLGLGQRLLDRCLAAARRHGFRRVYLETMQAMTAARRLYARNGFVPVDRPLGHTGHFGCDAWLVRDL